MFFNEEKNIAFFNKQSLDTYHEIVVSFDYARYSRESVPTGGFAVVFFRSNFDKPKGGGPGFALGYLPSDETDYCKLDGYKGLNGSILGVGFDLNGRFALPGRLYDGNNNVTPNSVTVRMGFEDNYKYIATSKNFLNTPSKIKIAERLQDEEEVEYNSVRITISNGFTKIKVEIKKETSRDFFTVFETHIPPRERDAVKVALTSTIVDDNTKFDVRNFNVMGYPGTPRPEKFDNCIQRVKLSGFSQGRTIVTENNFAAVPVGGNIEIYKLQGGELILDQILSDTSELILLGGSKKFLITNTKNTTKLVLWYNNNNRFFRSQDINLTEDSLATDDPLLYFFDEPTCADTDDQTMAIGNGSQVVVYEYFLNFASSEFGSFLPTLQTLYDELSGGLGVSVQVEGDKLLAGSSKGFVNFYLNNGNEFLLESTINDPVTGNPYSKFGHSLSLERNDLIIGAPQAYKLRYNTVGQGEAYHYFYSFDRNENRRIWRRVMNLGNFFLVDTPGGEFGYSVKLAGNNLIVSAPFENYLKPPEQPFENIPNCGRVYFFEKTRAGIFTQGTAVAPDSDDAVPYAFFGKYVGFINPNVGVSVTPYTPGGRLSELNFINKDCVFETPPKHLPISFQSIALVDNAGYMIDIETLTYMQLLCVYTAYDKSIVNNDLFFL